MQCHGSFNDGLATLKTKSGFQNRVWCGRRVRGKDGSGRNFVLRGPTTIFGEKKGIELLCLLYKMTESHSAKNL